MTYVFVEMRRRGSHSMAMVRRCRRHAGGDVRVVVLIQRLTHDVSAWTIASTLWRIIPS
jgi:hypothetical protein